MRLTHQPRIIMLLENASFPEDSRVLMQARSLTQAGYKVTVVGPTEQGQTKICELFEGIKVIRYPLPPNLGGILGYITEYVYSIFMQWAICIYLFFRNGFDTIHMHTPPDMNAIIPILFRGLGKKFVYDVHDLSPELYLAQRGLQNGGLIYWLLLRFECLASRFSNISITTNQSQRDIQVARCRVGFEKYHIVRNGPNETFLREGIQARHEIVRPGCITLGYVGVMGPQDGVDYLIRAIDLLVNHRKRSDIRLVLVGDGAALKELKRQVHSLGLSDHVLFTGRIPFEQVPSYIAAFDICCTPDPSNRYNDSCTTIKTMEYMALGKPVVSFCTTENMKTAEDAALYAPGNDVDQYASMIERLMDDLDLRLTMGRIGRQRVQEQLAWQHQSKYLLSAYDQLHQVYRFEGGQGPTGTNYHSLPSLPQDLRLIAAKQDGTNCTLSDTANGAVHFVFNGAVSKVLAKYFQRDRDAARLSPKFRAYYMVRSLLPLRIRQFMQRSRNGLLKVPEDWYVPTEFMEELKSVSIQLRRDVGQQADVLPSRDLVIHPWPDGNRFAISLTHDIESAQGLARVAALADLEERLGLRSAWFFVPHKYKIDPGLIRDLKARGHEVGIHGYNHDGRLFVSRSIFSSRLPRINLAGRRLDAQGFRAPMAHRNYQWMQELDFNYDASCFDIDPFQPMPGGVGGVWPFIVGKIVELPYTLPQDHTLMITLGHRSASVVWSRKLKIIRQLSGLALLITHPDYLDSSARTNEYRRFCEQLSEYDDKWLALPNEIARWWRLRHASQVTTDGEITGPAAHRGRAVPLHSVFESL